MRTKITLLFTVMLLTLVACQSNDKKEKPENLDPKAIQVVVKEIIQTSNYTYLKLDDYGDMYWAAVNKMEAKEGDVFYYLNSMEMTNFHSEELDRTFDKILFIEYISEEPIIAADETKPHDMNKVMAGKIDTVIDPANGGISLEELFADKDSYNTKTVIVRGKVTKFNKNIMGRNWVHIQDGTESNGEYDLTITTDDEVKVGDIVTFEGAIALNKDFGFNYKYDVIMEVAKLKNAKSM